MAWAIDYGVDRLVAIRLRIGDVVVKFLVDMREIAVHNTERGIAILNLLHNHTHGTHIIELRERQMLALHLTPDTVDVLWTAIDLGPMNAVLLQHGA